MTRRVLVTGGATRLGALICGQFVQAGWEVWCHYHRSSDAAERLCAHWRAKGGAIQAVAADLHDEAQREKLISDISERAGPLDALVNNASSFEPDTGACIDIQGGRNQLEVNLLAPLSLSAHMARSVAGLNDGLSGQRSIIHILDQKVYNLNPDYFSYTVSKLALERAVALQAQALAPAIRVCGIAPGLMFLSGPQTQANFDRAGKVNLLRRATDPVQVAETCLFLANSTAITGTTVCVDNGQHLVPLDRDVMFVVQDLLGGQHAG